MYYKLGGLEMKKMITLVMSLIIVFSLTTPVAANQHNFGNLSDSNISSFVMDGVVHSIRGEELSNGDVRFYQYMDGILIYSGIIYNNRPTRMYVTNHLSRGNETVEVLDFSNIIVQVETINDKNSLLRTRSFMGTVRFDWHGVWDSGTAGVAVYQTVGTTIRTTHALVNHTTTLVGLAGLLATALGLPGMLAGTTAGWILGGVGIATGLGSFLIPHSVVSADRAPVTYDFVNIDNLRHTDRFSTTRFIVRDQANPRLLDQTFWEGLDNFSTPTLWRTNFLAIQIVNQMFGFHIWNVRSWS